MALIDFEELSSRTLRMTLAQPLTVEQTLIALRDEPDFRRGFSEALATLPFVALRWETPRMTVDTLGDPFEAVVIDSPSLDRAQDADAFADQFEAHTGDVLTIPNLGGDALMVVPRPMSDAKCYCHLASFLRGAPEAQRDALWIAVAEATLGRVGSKPLWLSTAGGGVAWLHVRLDARPKYYNHTAYKVG